MRSSSTPGPANTWAAEPSRRRAACGLALADSRRDRGALPPALSRKRQTNAESTMPYRDDDHEVLHSREFPDPGEQGAALLPCPHCMGVISEVSERCPHCGNWLSEEDAP